LQAAGQSTSYALWTNPVPGPKYATTKVQVEMFLFGSTAATIAGYISRDGTNNNGGTFGATVADSNLQGASWWVAVDPSTLKNYYKSDKSAGTCDVYIDTMAWVYSR